MPRAGWKLGPGDGFMSDVSLVTFVKLLWLKSH
jgi:hypothetical protein